MLGALVVFTKATHGVGNLRVVDRGTAGGCVRNRARTISVRRQRPNEVVAVLRFITVVYGERLQNGEGQKSGNSQIDLLLKATMIEKLAPQRDNDIILAGQLSPPGSNRADLRSRAAWIA